MKQGFYRLFGADFFWVILSEIFLFYLFPDPVTSVIVRTVNLIAPFYVMIIHHFLRGFSAIRLHFSNRNKNDPPWNCPAESFSVACSKILFLYLIADAIAPVVVWAKPFTASFNVVLINHLTSPRNHRLMSIPILIQTLYTETPSII